MYLIQIGVDIPYPKEFESRQDTGSVSAAVSRAIREARKQLKGKRIKVYRVKAIKV